MNPSETNFSWNVRSAVSYALDEQGEAQLPVEELEKKPFVEVRSPELSDVLAKAVFQPLREGESIAAKNDHRLIIFTSDAGEAIRVTTSNHGGMFWVISPQGARGYYHFPDQKDFLRWHDLFFGETFKGLANRAGREEEDAGQGD
jgi:hypothetical protein